MQDARTLPRPFPRFHPDHRAARLEPQRPPSTLEQAEELRIARKVERTGLDRGEPGGADRPRIGRGPDLALGLLRRARDRRQARFLGALPRRTLLASDTQPPFDFPTPRFRARGRSGVAPR